MTDDIKIPQLTLTPVLEGELGTQETVTVKSPVKLEDSTLTPEEQAIVDNFAKQIDIKNTNVILLYGSAAQKNIADFSDTALNNVRTKDMGEAGEMLSSLVAELKGFNEETDAKKGFFGIARSYRRHVEILKNNYGKLEASIDSICRSLEQQQTILLKDVAMLDKMYDMNKVYFKELTMYILAGEKKLGEVRAVDFVQLIDKARATGNQMDAQAANDLSSMCDRFEKKLHDLKLTRQVSIQMAPQIRMMQNNNSLLIEKIQTSIVNTIPLWKNQMVLSLGLAHSQQAMKAQREVTNMTNELLKRNADTLKQGTMEIAKESERSIIDLETLKHTNASLISTLDEVMKIQSDGRAQRREAETQIAVLEAELKDRLLKLRDAPPEIK